MRKIHEENGRHSLYWLSQCMNKWNSISVLNTAQKGLTDEGKAELLTKADLVSNFLILDVLQRFPRLNVSCIGVLSRASFQ